MQVLRILALALTLALSWSGGFGCNGGHSDDDDDFDPNTPPPPLTDSRDFRAIAGVSMGGYGAMNLGTKHPDLFGTIASLGGPVDMTQLLHDIMTDNLEVKAQTEIPREIGEDFTFDHLPPYPERDGRLSMIQDLVLAFGNPLLHHEDPNRVYLASDSQPAALGRDDAFDNFSTLPGRGFVDGGDENEDGLRQTNETPDKEADVLLLAGGSAAALAGGATLTPVGNRSLADLNGDGIYDVGDGIVLNLFEPFTDTNGNLVFEPALNETFTDAGLDGVMGTGDFGEGNAQFDYDPDHARWLQEDPFTRVAARTAAEISTQRVYMDVGVADELGFARHYDNFVAMLGDKGIAVDVRDGFSSNCAELPDLDSQFTYVRYDAGHVGVASVDPSDLIDGNICGDDTVWQRLLTMIGYLNESFPDGFFGPGGDFELPDIDFDDLDIDFPDLDPRGEIEELEIVSPALAESGGAGPQRQVVVYKPPAFFHSDEDFPVVYFLGGYGQEPGDFVRIGDLLDILILSGQLQNIFMVFVPGSGGQKGSFYVNHAVAEAQAGAAIESPTSGRYEDSLLQDLIPFIEDEVLERRVRR